ncbi:MAG: hypothetical protein E7387_00305 [Ruminococcaceae bacterium]|nr:hypothetical protein [Oscillospiraceae bacterium]
MKKDLTLWQIIGFGFTSLGGTLLHFLYEFTNESFWSAPFSAVNESTWEHMKLLFFPLFIYALIQSRYFKEYKNFWCIKLAGITTGLVIIPALFYTYNGAFGKSPDWLNITIFFIGAFIAFLLETWLFKNNIIKCRKPLPAFILLVLICILFVFFTFTTPKLPIFRDPITGTYGI